MGVFYGNFNPDATFTSDIGSITRLATSQHLLVATCRKKSSSSLLSIPPAFWLLMHA